MQNTNGRGGADVDAYSALHGLARTKMADAIGFLVGNLISEDPDARAEMSVLYSAYLQEEVYETLAEALKDIDLQSFEDWADERDFEDAVGLQLNRARGL